MLNFVCRKKGGLKFALFYTFFTNNLSQKGYCAPSVLSSLPVFFNSRISFPPLIVPLPRFVARSHRDQRSPHRDLPYVLLKSRDRLTSFPLSSRIALVLT